MFAPGRAVAGYARQNLSESSPLLNRPSPWLACKNWCKNTGFLPMKTLFFSIQLTLFRSHSLRPLPLGKAGRLAWGTRLKTSQNRAHKLIQAPCPNSLVSYFNLSLRKLGFEIHL